MLCFMFGINSVSIYSYLRIGLLVKGAGFICEHWFLTAYEYGYSIIL